MSNTPDPYIQCVQDIRSQMALHLLSNTLPYELLTALLNNVERDHHRSTPEAAAIHAKSTESSTSAESTESAKSVETPALGNVAGEKLVAAAVTGRPVASEFGIVNGVEMLVWVDNPKGVVMLVQRE